MADRTHIQDETLYFGSLEFTNMLIRMCRGYQFLKGNQLPKAIHIPRISSITIGKEVVPVEYEQPAGQSENIKASKPRRGKAGTSDSSKAM